MTIYLRFHPYDVDIRRGLHQVCIVYMKPKKALDKIVTSLSFDRLLSLLAKGMQKTMPQHASLNKPSFDRTNKR